MTSVAYALTWSNTLCIYSIFTAITTTTKVVNCKWKSWKCVYCIYFEKGQKKSVNHDNYLDCLDFGFKGKTCRKTIEGKCVICLMHICVFFFSLSSAFIFFSTGLISFLFKQPVQDDRAVVALGKNSKMNNFI